VNYKQISAILLAAGKSERLGTPKQLIPWQGTTLLEFTFTTIQRSGFEDIIVVLGAYAELVKQKINTHNMRIVYNAAWESGKASSIRAGLNAISTNAEGVMIFLCDQPFLSRELIRKIQEAAGESTAEIIAPKVAERWSNPVFFKKKAFPSFYILKGEEGGKDLFSRYTMKAVLWSDLRILYDIDTVQDIEKLENINFSLTHHSNTSE